MMQNCKKKFQNESSHLHLYPLLPPPVITKKSQKKIIKRTSKILLPLIRIAQTLVLTAVVIVVTMAAQIQAHQVTMI